MKCSRPALAAVATAVLAQAVGLVARAFVCWRGNAPEPQTALRRAAGHRRVEVVQMVSAPRPWHSVSASAGVAPARPSHLCAAAAAAAVWASLRLKRGRAALRCLGDSATWLLPSVDKDVGDFHAGRAASYAWVQTSDTVYIFSPMPKPKFDEFGEKEPPQVDLQLEEEGSIIRFTVEDKPILNGQLAHSLKVGDQIWMIEDGPDGNSSAVCELDKLTPGLEWCSVMHPEVEVLTDYSKPVVEQPELMREQEEATVEETLQHLQQQKRVLLQADEGRAAASGDVLTIDMQGFELTGDDSRGAALEIGSAQGMEFELGSAGFSKEIQESVVGIKVGETKDVQVTLGKNAGEMGGQKIICAVTCQAMKEQKLPTLDDEFAKALKREEQFKQAGTVEGIPEEEEGIVETFTLADLRAEIAREVRQVTVTQSNANVDEQLKSHLRQALKVSCEWASLSQEGQAAEELAAIARAVAVREGLMANIDMDAVSRETWDRLAEPDAGESVKEVGKDPARDYQASYKTVLGEKVMEEVLAWLRQRMEIVPAGEGQ